METTEKFITDIVSMLVIVILFFAVWLNLGWFFYAKYHLRFNEYNDYKIYKATKGISVVYIAKIRTKWLLEKGIELK